MYRDTAQRSEIAWTLLSHIGKRDLWDLAEGPTETALAYLETKGGPLSHGQAIMLRLAFDVWSNDGHFDAAEALGTLDRARLSLVGSLFVAIAAGEHAIDDWIDRHTL